ncbi:MAG TPA: polymer-forming cytoskeletal protein [Ferruginibacter sp.]|nr:polymer-forming cytoskeletal protein [Ferruginibacter sp.]
MFNSRLKSTETPVNDSASMIGAGTNITGHLDTNGDVRIDGTLKGNIYGKAKVLIGPMGVVEGDIHCREANIMGQVTGCIKVMELLHLKGKAAVAGDIHTAKLLIEPSVNFNGQCHMGANIVELNTDLPLAVNE